jgi:hypothetical protein
MIAIPRFETSTAALCLISAFAFTNARNLRYWQNGTKLLTRAASVAGRPDPGIEEFLADELISAGRVNEAYQHYGKACVLLPNYATCHFNMAEIIFSRHQLRDALDEYQELHKR